MNSVSLVGRLTRDPEVRYGQTGNAVAKFGLAVPRRFKREGEPEADFLNITAFGKTAEVVERYCNKGKQVSIIGRIQTGSYTNKDGAKVYTTDIIVDALELLGSKNDAAPAPTKPADPADQFGAFMAQADSVSDADLPFQ